MMTLVMPPKVLPTDADKTSAAGIALPADNKATNKTSEFPGNNVALKKLLPNKEASARALLTAYARPQNPYWRVLLPQYRNQHLQRRHIFQEARQSAPHNAKKCPVQVCDSSRHWPPQSHQSNRAALNAVRVHPPSSAHFLFLPPLDAGHDKPSRHQSAAEDVRYRATFPARQPFSQQQEDGGPSQHYYCL